MPGIIKSPVIYSQQLSFLLACGAVIFGCVGLCGWVFDSFLLRSFFFADITMKVNTALLIIMIGSSVVLQHRHQRKAAIALLLLAGIFCTLILCEHIWQVDLGIDEWWFTDTDAAVFHTTPGRTSLFSAISLLMLVVIQLLVLFKRYYVSQLCGLVLLLFLYAILIGYLFNISGFYRQGDYSGVAFHTEISFIFLNLSVLLMQSSFGWMQLIMFFLRSRKGLLALIAYLMCAAPLLVSIYIFSTNVEHLSPAEGVVILVMLSLLVNIPIAYIVLSRIYRTDRTLKRTNQQLQIALLAGKLGTYNLELATGNMVCSEQCKANFGRQADLPFNFPDLMQAILPAYREQVNLKVNAAIEANGTYETEYQVNWPDGSLHWVQVAGKPEYDADGKGIAMVGITRDITEQKEMEAQKNAFIGIVSHELKTPLTSVKGYLQLLMIKAEADAATVSFVGKAQLQVDKMVSMIKSFLNVSRLESGVMQLEKSSFLMNELLSDVIQEQLFVQTSHHIIMNNCADVFITADREKVAQVISNLLGNAVKYSPNAKTIEVSCKTENNRVQIGIADKGIGVSASEIPLLFNRFYRANAKDAYFVSGFGIGLYLSAEIVKLHQGTIWVNSEPGQGSTFFFSLPME